MIDAVNNRETKEDAKVEVPANDSISFTPPFAQPGPAVLYLKQVGR